MIAIAIGILAVVLLDVATFSADAILVALSIGMVADSVRSNRIRDKEAALTMVKGMAEGMVRR